jgi:hypothetical protein
VLVLHATAELDSFRRASFEILVMPLVHSGSSISRMLGAVVAIDPPTWLGTERLPPLRMVSHEQIWPDGRPFAVMEKFRNAPALIPELSGARLVRIKRRSFRVLDGGLQES